MNDIEERLEPRLLRQQFILRRAFRSPSRMVVRSDLQAAFDIGGTQASALLSEQVEASGGLLERRGHRVIAPPWAEPPGYAGEADLMEHLDKGLCALVFTGLYPEELPVSYVSWSESLPQTPGTFWQLMRAIGQQKSVYVHYVSMRRGDEGRWRRIMPLRLERMGDQWRVCAQDLQHDDFPLRTFVLARLLACKPDDESPPRGFVRANAHDSIARTHPVLDSRLTSTQRQVLEYELRIRKGVLQLPAGSVHEFGIRFADGQTSDAAIWPPLRLER